jgi:hypothetical protein
MQRNQSSSHKSGSLPTALVQNGGTERMAFLLRAARPRKHPKTGVYEYRQAIPQRLRPFAKGGREEPGHEYKRSLHTKKADEAKRRLPDAIREYLKYERELEARKAKAESAALGVRNGGRKRSANIWAFIVGIYRFKWRYCL